MTTPLQDSVHLEMGCRNDIAFLFSCPGQEEEKHKRPAKGQTGTNLEDLLEKMRDTYGLTEFTRGEVWITNAWDKVLYKNKIGSQGKIKRTEATLAQIRQTTNLDRLTSELHCINGLIVCCGKRAIEAVDCLRRRGALTVSVAKLDHLGNQSLNSRIKKDVRDRYIKEATEDSSERRQLRIERVAKCLYDQLPPAFRRPARPYP